ncbi:MAG: phage integrase SAM-like domain-containing protein [Chitinophagaceae bacterium]
MGSVGFYLKRAEPSTGRSLIYLQFKYNGHRLVFSFGQSIHPKNWNYNKQRVKNNRETTSDGDHLLNDLLDSLEQLCEKSYKAELKNGVPTPGRLKEYLIDFINQNKTSKQDRSTLFNLIDRFISGEILKRDGKEKSRGSINNYKTVKLHLQAFEKKYRYPIDFNTITLEFFGKYVSFLRKEVEHTPYRSDFHEKKVYKKGLSNNTIAKDISLIKAFMGEAVDLGYTDNYQFRHKKFSFSEEQSDAVYLTEHEIIKLYRHDFSFNKKLERARDLFVFGCFVGLRYSDYSDIKPENIVQIDGEHFIKVKTKKTGDVVIIPCNPVVMDIFNRYKDSPNKLPRAFSGQKFNDYIKDVCRLAGFVETGRLATNMEKPLFNCVSSHTARRSFATNFYLQGFPTIDLMKITGHKTEKAFLTYIRVSKLDSAKRLSQHIKKSWSEVMLSVAYRISSNAS